MDFYDLENIEFLFPKLCAEITDAVKIAKAVYPDFEELVPLVVKMYEGRPDRPKGMTMEQELFMFFDKARLSLDKADVHTERLTR